MIWEALVTLSALEWLLPWWFPHVPSSGQLLRSSWHKKLVSCVGPLMFLQVEECLRECLQFCQNPFSLSQLRWILQREGSLSVTPLHVCTQCPGILSIFVKDFLLVVSMAATSPLLWKTNFYSSTMSRSEIREASRENIVRINSLLSCLVCIVPITCLIS